MTRNTQSKPSFTSPRQGLQDRRMAHMHGQPVEDVDRLSQSSQAIYPLQKDSALYLRGVLCRGENPYLAPLRATGAANTVSVIGHGIRLANAL